MSERKNMSEIDKAIKYFEAYFGVGVVERNGRAVDMWKIIKSALNTRSPAADKQGEGKADDKAVINAAYKHVENMVPQANGNEGGGPWWFGWAIRESFIAGVQWLKSRRGL